MAEKDYGLYARQAASLAQNWPDHALATEPALYVDDSCTTVRPEMKVTDAVDFLATNEVPEEYLQGLGITFSANGAGGSMTDARVLHDVEKIHYPHITVYVPQDPAAVQEQDLNWVLRHEAKHVIQACPRGPLYAHQHAMRACAGAGAILNITGAALYTGSIIDIAKTLGGPEYTELHQYTADMAQFIGGALLLGYGISASVSPRRFLDHTIHDLTPREISANRFANRTAGFNPITI